MNLALAFKRARRHRERAPVPALPPPDVRAYLAKLAPEPRSALLKLRAQVLAAAPGATERISYKIPGFERDGRMLVWMAAFPGHCSFFGGHEAARIAAQKGLNARLADAKKRVAKRPAMKKRATRTRQARA